MGLRAGEPKAPKYIPVRRAAAVIESLQLVFALILESMNNIDQLWKGSRSTSLSRSFMGCEMRPQIFASSPQKGLYKLFGTLFG